MPRTASVAGLAGGLAALVALAVPSSASAGDVSINVYRPPPVVVRPPPPYVTHYPARVVVRHPVAGCTVRTVRTWVNGRYVFRTVRVCR